MSGSTPCHWTAPASGFTRMPAGLQGVEKNGPQAIGRSRGGRTTKIHLVAATARQAVIFCLSAGNEGDALRGRELLMRMGRIPEPCHLLMDHVYEGDETHELAQALGFIPVVPPSPNRKNPWDYDTIIYKRRNEVERLIRRVKSCRRVFTRYDKLDIMFLGFIVFAFIVEFLRLC